MKPSLISISATFNFSDPDGLSPLQCEFLRACATEPAGLAEVARRVDVPGDLLAGWLEKQRFRRRLRRVIFGVKRRREATLALVSSRAADRLAEGVDDKAALNADQRRTCVELLKLAREVDRKRPARSKEPDVVLPQEIDLEEKSRLLERLENQE